MSEQQLMELFMSVCLSVCCSFFYGVGNLHDQGQLLQKSGNIVGTKYCDIGKRGHCWNIL
jgi:hypothetical protein